MAIGQWCSSATAITCTLDPFQASQESWLPSTAEDNEVRLESAFCFEDTIERLRTALEAKGFTIMAVIDHRAAAAAVGLAMPPTTVLIYGNPKGGTPLMLAAPDFALELPLRVLVREGAAGKATIVFNPADSLEGKHGLPRGWRRGWPRRKP
jgi:uncharacterized protein (DUF302 family)